jgi:hypothetical protein
MGATQFRSSKPWYAKPGFWLTAGALVVLLCLCLGVAGGGVYYGLQGKGPLSSLASPTPRKIKKRTPPVPAIEQPAMTEVPLPATEAPAPPPTEAPMQVSVLEEFDQAEAFISTDPDVTVADGRALWSVARNGGEQLLYRSIPTISGNVHLYVVGRVDYASNNCAGRIGIGDAPGTGISVSYGWFGGGCPKNGFLVDVGDGIALDHSMDGCDFIGDWMWIGANKDYHTDLETLDGMALLSVSGVGLSKGQVTYNGLFNTLWVGLKGDGDWPSCSGSFDSILIEQRP